MPAYKLIIDGKKVSTTETFPVLNPATEKVVAQAPKATVEQLNEAVAAARRAFPPGVPPRTRSARGWSTPLPIPWRPTVRS